MAEKPKKHLTTYYCKMQKGRIGAHLARHGKKQSKSSLIQRHRGPWPGMLTLSIPFLEVVADVPF